MPNGVLHIFRRTGIPRVLLQNSDSIVDTEVVLRSVFYTLVLVVVVFGTCKQQSSASLGGRWRGERQRDEMQMRTEDPDLLQNLFKHPVYL